jgi:chromosomal replication initiator protein
MENISSLWEKTLKILQSKLNPISYETWVQPLQPVKKDEERKILYLITNDYFVKTTLEKRYISVIEDVLFDICGEKIRVSVSAEDPSSPEKKSDSSFEDASLSEETIPNPRYIFKNFIVGKNNSFAHAAAVAVAEDPSVSESSKTAYNPLFIYGNAGLGKTHLMHAIWHYIDQNNPELRVLYVSSEMFTNELIKAIKDQKTFQFRNKYRNIDVLLIDDIQFIEKKDSTQEEMFHTINTLYEAYKQIIISSDRAPKNFTFNERLRSRFEWGLVADIQPPDFETRVAILRNKAELDGHKLTDDLLDVINLISEKIHFNIRELEGALNRVVAHGNLLGRNIDRDLARETLKDIFFSKENQPSPENIKKHVCKHFNIKISEIESSKKARKYSYPRQVAMYLCRKMTDLSLTSIGEHFGNRDYTTVLYAAEKITNEINLNESFGEIISKLEENIHNS